VEILEHESNRVQPEVSKLIILEFPYVLVFYRDAAFIGTQYSRNDAQQRRLAAAGRSFDKQHFAEGGIKTGVFNCVRSCFPFPEPLHHVPCTNRQICHQLDILFFAVVSLRSYREQGQRRTTGVEFA